MGVHSQNKRSGPCRLVISTSAKFAASPPFLYGPKQRQNRPSPLLGGNRLRYWLCPSLKRPSTDGGLLSLYFGISSFLSPCMVTTRASVSSHLLLPPNFLELRKAGVRRINLSCTPVSKGKRKGWAMGKPTSNSRRERELLRR